MGSISRLALGCSLVLGVLAAGFLVYTAGGQYLQHGRPASTTATCTTLGVIHQVRIQRGIATPDAIEGHRCERLAITNEDTQARLMAFGEHDHHQPYDGVTERILGKGQTLTVVLNQIGTFQFHDHIDDTAIGRFTVVR